MNLPILVVGAVFVGVFWGEHGLGGALLGVGIVLVVEWAYEMLVIEPPPPSDPSQGQP
jgi:hypothetical protein